MRAGVLPLLALVPVACIDTISFPEKDSGDVDSEAPEADADTDVDSDTDADADADSDADADPEIDDTYTRLVECSAEEPWTGPADWSWFGTPPSRNWVTVRILDGVTWGLGEDGTLLWYDGTQLGWTSLPDGAAGDGLAPLTSELVWVLTAGGSLLRWDGEDFDEVEAPAPLVDLHAVSSTQVWAVSTDTIYRWEGGAWSEEATGSGFVDLWAGQIVAALDEDGMVTRQEGEGWVVEEPGSGGMTVIRGAYEILWVAGPNSQAAWFEDGVWTRMPLDHHSTSLDVTDLWTQGTSFTWLFGMFPGAYPSYIESPGMWTWDGEQASGHFLDHEVRSIDAVSPVVAVAGPELFGRLAELKVQPAPPQWAVDSMAVDSDGAAWVLGGRSRTLHQRLDSEGWEAVEMPPVGRVELHELAFDDTRTWLAAWEAFAGSGSLWLDEGDGWEEVEGVPTVRADGLAPDGAGGVWSHGATVLNHFDGSTWSTPWIRPVGPGSFWAGQDDALWVVEDLLLAWDGASWSNAGGIDGIDGIEGRAADDLWALGGDVAWHWDGVSWTEHHHGGYGSFGRVWVGEDELWAVSSSDGGGLLHWDGQDWEYIAFFHHHHGLVSFENPQDVWADGQEFVWVVGHDREGLVCLVEGEWDTMGDAFGELTAVDGVAADDVWFGGERLYRWDGSVVAPVEIPTLPGEGPADSGGGRDLDIVDLVVESPDRVWLVAGELGCHLIRYEGSGEIESWDLGGEERCGSHQLRLVAGEPWVLIDATRILRLREGAIETVHEFDQAQTLCDAYAPGSDEVWVAGDPATLHVRDGVATWYDWGATRAVAAAEGVVWLATDEALLRVEDDEAISYPVAGVRGLWVGSAVEALAVGESGSVHRWDGTSWTAEESGTVYDLDHVGADGGMEWAAGDCALLRRELE